MHDTKQTLDSVLPKNQSFEIKLGQKDVNLQTEEEVTAVNSGDQHEFTTPTSEKDVPEKNSAVNYGMASADPSGSTQVKLQGLDQLCPWDCLGEGGLIPFVISDGRD